MNYKTMLNSTFQKISKLKDSGKVASYIPELRKIKASNFAASLTTIDRTNYAIGDSKIRFSIQSISKVLSLTLAYQKLGEKIWNRVGVEPSGNAFNSLVQLEYDRGIPRNPFINAGAIVICDILITHLNNPKKNLIKFIRDISDNDKINFDQDIAKSEKEYGHKNAALVNLMKSFNNIDNDPDEVLDFYYNMCSISMNCTELSRLFLYLANNGIHPKTNNKILSLSQSKRINALLLTCGFYDESGEFSFKVGLPGKSGVGGGIVAIYPNHYSIAVWSPRLNKKGNSYKGMKFLETFTTKTKMSIF